MPQSPPESAPIVTHLVGSPVSSSGASGFGFVPDAGEVDGAGGVEGFLRASDGEAGEQDGVFVAVAGGGVDGEAEGVRGAAVAEPEQRDLLAAGQDPGDVSERAAAGGLNLVQLGPVLLGVIQQPQGDGAAG